MTEKQQPHRDDAPNGSEPQAPSDQTPTSKGDPTPSDPAAPGSIRQTDPASNLDLKSARTLATVASIAGPISLIVGGVALSTVALVCAIIALTKVRNAQRQAGEPIRAYAKVLRQTALMAVFISSIAFVVNAVGVALMMPVLLEAMQTGDFSAILGEGATIATQPSSGGNAWG